MMMMIMIIIMMMMIIIIIMIITTIIHVIIMMMPRDVSSQMWHSLQKQKLVLEGIFFSKAIIHSLNLTCFSFISFYSELTSLYISTPYHLSSMNIEFHLWYENYRRHFSNLSSMKVFVFQLQFHWSLFPRVQLIISQHWFRQWLGTEQARNHYPNQCWPNSPTHVYTALGGNKITTSGRSFHWDLVHLVQSASLCWNSPKIFHTVFETLPVGAKSLPILPPDYWHPPQSNFTEYKQDVVAVFYAPVNGQWVN